VKKLIDNHFHVNVSDIIRNPALILLDGKGRLECVKLLIENNCDVNSNNSD
jgi:ankyrin repeat protein